MRRYLNKSDQGVLRGRGRPPYRILDLMELRFTTNLFNSGAC